MQPPAHFETLAHLIRLGKRPLLHFTNQSSAPLHVRLPQRCCGHHHHRFPLHPFPSPDMALLFNGQIDLTQTQDGAFLLPNCYDPFNKKALRATHGSSSQLPLVFGSWSHLSALKSKHDMKLLAGHPESTTNRSNASRSLSHELMELFIGRMMEGDNFSVFGNGTQVDSKVFQSFQKSFLQVQSILDQNRLLINEINQNHESKIPDSLSRNVGLIRELNNNIRRVVDLYADLSLSFTKSVEASSEWSSAVRQPSHKRSRPEHQGKQCNEEFNSHSLHSLNFRKFDRCLHMQNTEQEAVDLIIRFQADEQGWVDTIKSVRFGGAVRISTMDWLGQSQYLRQTVFWPSLSSAVSELLKQVIFSKHALVNMLVTYWSHFLDGTDEYLKSILYSTILCHSSSRNNCKGRVNIKYYIVLGYKKTGAAKSNKDRSSRIFVLGSVDRTAYAKGIRIKEGSGGFPKVPLISPILLMAACITSLKLLNGKDLLFVQSDMFSASKFQGLAQN
ncbi:hypothetical protein ZIOFF_021584 [Zingiber officinale]|uniref:Protein EARLY FLOWERING 4 domain-containing protein n=1 Tax=Zingiber officinale TaxID=94328 RepID=A0A8J5HKA0_ZINOF|nr:hypothetical protein ZIOFF_021584 [Zingiber officinale]